MFEVLADAAGYKVSAIGLTPPGSPRLQLEKHLIDDRVRYRSHCQSGFYVALTRAKSHLHVRHPHRYYFHNHRQSDQHSYSQRTRFIPDELLPWFEPVTVRKSTWEFPQGEAAGEVTMADVRRRIGRTWA